VRSTVRVKLHMFRFKKNCIRSRHRSARIRWCVERSKNQTSSLHRRTVIRKSANEGCKTQTLGFCCRRQLRCESVCMHRLCLFNNISMEALERDWRATSITPMMLRKSATKSSSSQRPTVSSAAVYKASGATSALGATSPFRIISRHLVGACPLINLAAVDAHAKSPDARCASWRHTSSPGQSALIPNVCWWRILVKVCQYIFRVTR
jgi:hypothetical protein